jgi:hypothetical protein
MLFFVCLEKRPMVRTFHYLKMATITVVLGDSIYWVLLILRPY